ncbi:MAG: hypothetical protein NTX03_12105 [Bacteroidetes bacterium]|nr:hypothetical protein [Bacteroidota bacterium]
MFCNIAKAQENKSHKEDFSAAVDQINCATMKFLHREGGRNDVADKMECFTFESILHSVPEDEANTTGKFCKNINLCKDKFKEAEDAAKQIDAVITYAYSRIASKKRKGSIEDFKNKLAAIKDETIKNIAEADNPKTQTKTDETADAKDKKPDEVVTNTPTTANVDSTKKDNADVKPPTDTQPEIMPENSKTSANNWMLWGALGISILALIFSIFTILRLRNHIENNTKSEDGFNEVTNRPITPMVTESKANYRELENQFNDELKKLRAYVDERLSGAKNVNSNPQPTAKVEMKSEPVSSGYTAQQLADEIKTTVAKATIDLSSTSLFSEANNLSTSSMESVADENESTPVYKYGTPSSDGNFDIANFDFEASPDSVFQVETYDDVPDRAFFSPLTFPFVADKILSNKDTLLSPFCVYDEETDGKKKIILLEDGVIEKQDSGNWKIISKARVKLE